MHETADPSFTATRASPSFTAAQPDRFGAHGPRLLQASALELEAHRTALSHTQARQPYWITTKNIQQLLELVMHAPRHTSVCNPAKSSQHL